VWFFSLDVDRRLPAYVARGAYQLPYCFGDTTHTRVGGVLTTSVERRWPRGPRWPAAPRPARSEIVVRAGDPVDAGDPLHRFLTARWGLVAVAPTGSPRWAPVEHPAWPLRAATIDDLDDTLVAVAGIEVDGPPASVLWSPGVPVRVGRPRRVVARSTAPASTGGTGMDR
jgi:uncharacterized protein YqjF (DUF2071 family)